MIAHLSHLSYPIIAFLSALVSYEDGMGEAWKWAKCEGLSHLQPCCLHLSWLPVALAHLRVRSSKAWGMPSSHHYAALLNLGLGVHLRTAKKTSYLYFPR